MIRVHAAASGPFVLLISCSSDFRASLKGYGVKVQSGEKLYDWILRVEHDGGEGAVVVDISPTGGIPANDLGPYFSAALWSNGHNAAVWF